MEEELEAAAPRRSGSAAPRLIGMRAPAYKPRSGARPSLRLHSSSRARSTQHAARDTTRLQHRYTQTGLGEPHRCLSMASALHDHSHGGDDECSSPHAMAFHAGVCQEILFSGWMTTSALQLAGSAALIFVAGVLYEGLKYFREALFVASAPPRSSQLNIAKSECGASGGCSQATLVKQTMFSRSHATQTLLHVVQTTFSYLLMLIFMTYNVWLCLALVLGLACGYFLFGWKKQTVVDVTEHCQ